MALKNIKSSIDPRDANILFRLGAHPNIIPFFGFFQETNETVTVITAYARCINTYMKIKLLQR